MLVSHMAAPVAIGMPSVDNRHTPRELVVQLVAPVAPCHLPETAAFDTGSPSESVTTISRCTAQKLLNFWVIASRSATRSIFTGSGVAVGTGVAVAAGTGVAVGCGMAVAVGSGIAVAVAAGTGVAVGSGIAVGVGSGAGSSAISDPDSKFTWTSPEVRARSNSATR